MTDLITHLTAITTAIPVGGLITAPPRPDKSRTPPARQHPTPRPYPPHTNGPVLGSVSFLARSFDVRAIGRTVASVVAIEPGGHETHVASLDWTTGPPATVHWADTPARHALVTNGTRLQLALEQRFRAVVEHAAFAIPLPQRFADEIRKGADHASRLPAL
ncbi:hypothetical protein [Salininema proteolyticum]|uniref:Uncharacterized protein n=1 Tax=Salininema proteolyticum TaxID=1607685 RepID=A0ABV8U540_9ACTN